MNIILLVSLSYLTYISTCLYYGRMENKTTQRDLAFVRSGLNFVVLFLISICIPFKNIPESKNNMFVVLFLWVIIADMWFTITHRLLHHNKLYWIHKQHHENNPSFSTSTFDSHIIEFLFGNVLTGLLPMVIINGSHLTQFIWIVFANINTTSGHHEEGPHLTHHRLLKCNYGQGFYMWDKLFGTYRDA